MNCADCVELIARKLEGSLSATESSCLESHLAVCPRCRAEVALQTGIAQALALPEPAGLPAGFAQTVSNRAFSRARGEKRQRAWGYLIPIATTATLLVLAILYRANIAGVLAPSLSVVGQLADAAVGWLGSALGGVSVQAPAAAKPAAHLVGIWGPLACAAAIVILASSKIFTLARR
jgi:anti-sigma factor RsiW